MRALVEGFGVLFGMTPVSEGKPRRYRLAVLVGFVLSLLAIFALAYLSD